MKKFINCVSIMLGIIMVATKLTKFSLKLFTEDFVYFQSQIKNYLELDMHVFARTGTLPCTSSPRLAFKLVCLDMTCIWICTSST